MGISVPSGSRAFVRSGADVGTSRRPQVQFIPQGGDQGSVQDIHEPSSTPPLVNLGVFTDQALCTGASSCWNSLGLLVPLKGTWNASAHRVVPDNCVLPN